MGSCFGKCLAFKRRFFRNPKSHIARFKESSSIIEFESLIAEDEESIYPQSVVLPFEKALVHARRLDLLLGNQITRDIHLYDEKLRRKEDVLELQEDYFQEEISEVGSMEIINPSDLLLKSCDKIPSVTSEEDFDEFLERVRAKNLMRKDQPIILNPGQLLKNGSSTTQSSLELDWESDGLTYPQESANTDDDVLTRTETTSVRSHHDSNSCSNDLEWDEDVFIDQSELSRNENNDNETELLIEEIERLTSRALDETGPNR